MDFRHPRRCNCGKLYFSPPANAKQFNFENSDPVEAGNKGYAWVCSVCDTNLTEYETKENENEN